MFSLLQGVLVVFILIYNVGMNKADLQNLILEPIEEVYKQVRLLLRSAWL
jgi:hypothetical protein